MFIPFGIVASYVPASGCLEKIGLFVADRLFANAPVNLLAYEGGLGAWFDDFWTIFTSWLSRPQVMIIVITWAVTFTVVCGIILALGFGPPGVGAGTLAAAFQSFMYGAFTPAGGIFATLTSMAALGTLMPVAAACSALLATLVAGIVWASGWGG